MYEKKSMLDAPFVDRLCHKRRREQNRTRQNKKITEQNFMSRILLIAPYPYTI